MKSKTKIKAKHNKEKLTLYVANILIGEFTVERCRTPVNKQQQEEDNNHKIKSKNKNKCKSKIKKNIPLIWQV